MLKKKLIFQFATICIACILSFCVPNIVRKEANKNVPERYGFSQDSMNTAKQIWKKFFTDSNLVALIDTALKNNQELNIIMQDINIAKNEVRARKGMYLPFLNFGAIISGDKAPKYTRIGALERNNPIVNGEPNPEVMPYFLLGATLSWQIDIWKQLRNAKKAAIYRYLSSVEGKNFMITNLISKIAISYNELMALDNQLEIIKTNINIQKNALNIITLEKTAGEVTELAVLRFQAEVSKNQSRQYFVQQNIMEVQNNINFLLGRFAQPVQRNSTSFNELTSDDVYAGIPSQLLENRTDIKQAELELMAAKLDIKVAKANFYPQLNIAAGVGFEAFKPQFLFVSPQSILFNLAGNVVAPLINRNGIKAMYLSASARQIKSVYNYERVILNAYTEVINQQSSIVNLKNSYDFKSKQVDAMNKSINIAINLFKSGRADYVEVLFTQRDALESKIELIETKQKQLNANIKMYQVLGGGWR